MKKLEGKVAIVTGSDRGIGRGIALSLAKEGCKIVVNSHKNAKEGNDVVSEIKNLGSDALFVVADVSNERHVRNLVEKAVRKFGKLDILVNNAGIFAPKPALEITEEDWDKTININLKGEFLCAQRAAKEMAKNNWGRIINISSIASGQVGVGIEWGAHYTASKGGIIGMTETLAIELASLGINVNAIAPGAIDAPMLQSGAETEELKKYTERIPLKRIGKPEEVSAAVIFLASEEASYITGTTIYVDGGWLSQ